MRRVLFARAILKNPKILVLVSPMAGLDIAHVTMFKSVIDMLRNQGVDISVVDDEETVNPIESVKNSESDCNRKVVVEMRDITLRFGRRTLFENLLRKILEGQVFLGVSVVKVINRSFYRGGLCLGEEREVRRVFKKIS